MIRPTILLGGGVPMQKAIPAWEIGLSLGVIGREE